MLSLTQGITGSATGFTLTAGLAWANGESFEEGLRQGGQSALQGFAIGTSTGMVSGLRAAYKAGENPWNGKSIFGDDRNIEQVSSRTTRNNVDKAVKVKFDDGSVIDISEIRVKEYTLNNHPKAPEGTLQRVRFENSQPDSKGYKRNPTGRELKFLKFNF